MDARAMKKSNRDFPARCPAPKIGYAPDQEPKVVIGAAGIPKGDVPPVRFLVPLLTPAQRREYIIWVVVWLTVLISFWIWWLLPEHNIGSVGFTVTSIALAWITLLPLYFVFMFSRNCVPS